MVEGVLAGYGAAIEAKFSSRTNGFLKFLNYFAPLTRAKCGEPVRRDGRWTWRNSTHAP